MTNGNELRLLPWSGPEGKPCFLSTDGGYLSRLADNTEATQLGMAAELVEHASEVLTDAETKPEELRLLAADMARALTDALRVAQSRGRRMAIPDHSTIEGGDEEPQLPASAFG